eukprot:6075210-Pleurochrysis_carterae.AAC.2
MGPDAGNTLGTDPDNSLRRVVFNQAASFRARSFACKNNRSALSMKNLCAARASLPCTVPTILTHEGIAMSTQGECEGGSLLQLNARLCNGQSAELLIVPELFKGQFRQRRRRTFVETERVRISADDEILLRRFGSEKLT